jgi:hypothetical protein
MTKLQALGAFFQGKKVYITALLLVVYALVGFYLGKIDLNSLINDLFIAAGTAGFRSAINTLK